MSIEQLLEQLEQSTVGAYTIPVLYACIGVLFSLLVTGLMARFLRRWIEQAHQHREPTNALSRMLRTDASFLMKLLQWVRWVTIVLIVALAVSMLIEHTADLLIQSNKLKSTATALKKIDARLDQWIRTLGKTFWSLIFLFFAARLVEHAIQAVVTRYVVKQNEWRARARIQTLHVMSRYAVRVVTFIVISLTVLQTLGFNIAPLLATAGVASVAIGFGAQSLIKDVLAGFFILLEDQFTVGDVIAIDDKVGKVESMTLRITRLRAGDGQLIVIPNSEIKTVRNSTTSWTQFEFSIGIRYDQEPQRALAALQDEVTQLQREKQDVMMPLPEPVGVSKLTDQAVMLRAMIRTLPDKRWEVERELNQRVLTRFKSEKIAAASPRFELAGLAKIGS